MVLLVKDDMAGLERTAEHTGQIHRRRKYAYIQTLPPPEGKRSKLHTKLHLLK